MAQSSSLQWSEWIPVRDYGITPIPASKGVFELRHARGAAAGVIPRADGIDSEGLLYIGHADGRTLHDRVVTLCEAIVENGHPRHSVRKAYHEFGFEKRFPIEEVQFRFVEARLPRKVATQLIRQYLKRFKDKPPLNFTFTSSLEIL